MTARVAARVPARVAAARVATAKVAVMRVAATTMLVKEGDDGGGEGGGGDGGDKGGACAVHCKRARVRCAEQSIRVCACVRASMHLYAAFQTNISFLSSCNHELAQEIQEFQGDVRHNLR